MADVSALLNSKTYADTVEAIRARTKIQLYPTYPPPLQEMDRKNVEASGFAVEELQRILEADSDPLTRFSVAKIRQLRGEPIAQDYPPGEEPDEDDADRVIEERGFAKGFLLINLVEYSLLKERPDELEAYLKRRRTPQLKQYATQLRELFAAATG